MRGFFQDLTYSFCICINPVNPRDKVSTIPFQEYCIFRPKIIFIFLCHPTPKLIIVLATWIQDRAVVRQPTSCLRDPGSPATHHITVATKDFGEAADDYICYRQDVNVHEVTNCLIYYHSKVELIRKPTDASQIGRFE